MDLVENLSYDFINKNTVGVKRRNIGNIDNFLCLKINIGKIVMIRNTRFIEYEPINENPCINTSSDAKKLPGISQGKFKNLPLKYSKVDNNIIMFIWISPIFSEINFAKRKAIHQVNDKNKGSNAASRGIKKI